MPARSCFTQYNGSVERATPRRWGFATRISRISTTSRISLMPVAKQHVGTQWMSFVNSVLRVSSWLQPNSSTEYGTRVPQLPLSSRVRPARNPVYRIPDQPSELLFRAYYSLYATLPRQQVTEHRLRIKQRVGSLDSLGKLGRVSGGKDDLNGRGGAMTNRQLNTACNIQRTNRQTYLNFASTSAACSPTAVCGSARYDLVSLYFRMVPIVCGQCVN